MSPFSLYANKSMKSHGVRWRPGASTLSPRADELQTEMPGTLPYFSLASAAANLASKPPCLASYQGTPYPHLPRSLSRTPAPLPPPFCRHPVIPCAVLCINSSIICIGRGAVVSNRSFWCSNGRVIMAAVRAWAPGASQPLNSSNQTSRLPTAALGPHVPSVVVCDATQLLCTSWR